MFHFFKAIFDTSFRFSRPFFDNWNRLVIAKMVKAISGRNLPVLNCSYHLPRALVLGFDPKYIGPDLLSCSIKRNRVRVNIRVQLKKIGPDYPETGKHPREPTGLPM